jgi:hypothetical protein
MLRVLDFKADAPISVALASHASSVSTAAAKCMLPTQFEGRDGLNVIP